MLHALLIAGNREVAELLERVIRQIGYILLEQTHCPAPTHYQLTRSLNTLSPDAVFLDTDLPGAGQLREAISAQASRAAVVGFSARAGADTSALGLHMLDFPLSVPGVAATVRRAVSEATGRPSPNLVGFIPAKAGAGATTAAMNMACRLGSESGGSVVLVEADLRSGTLSDWLQVRPLQTLFQTLQWSDACGSLIWPRHVSAKLGVEWMLTGREPDMPQPSWCDYHHLLTFAAARYDYTLVDLPELLDDNVSAAAQLCEKIFVVTTPEFLTMKLGGLRIVELQRLGIERSRIRLIVNRSESAGLKPEEISQELGCELAAAFPNDYPAVSRAILQSTCVDDTSKLGRSYRRLAQTLTRCCEPPPKLESSPSKFGWMMGFRRVAEISRQ
jgi:MinD-like ATPase involved in chromosome partitioning or flagellar assembly